MKSYREIEMELGGMWGKTLSKRKEISGTPEFSKLEIARSDLNMKINALQKELRELRQPIYKKYVDVSWGLYFEAKKIKSSVKKGIKKGLGITSIALVSDDDLKKIVLELIEKNFIKTGLKVKMDNLNKEIKRIEDELDINYEKKERVMNEGLEELTNERRKMLDTLNKMTEDKKKVKGERSKVVKEHIDKNLPKLMNKITHEVDKRLMLEGLK